jgi:hypothetical protein
MAVFYVKLQRSKKTVSVWLTFIVIILESYAARIFERHMMLSSARQSVAYIESNTRETKDLGTEFPYLATRGA